MHWGENSLYLSGFGIGFWCTRSLVQILPGPYISAMRLFICFFVTDFVHKSWYSLPNDKIERLCRRQKKKKMSLKNLT